LPPREVPPGDALDIEEFLAGPDALNSKVPVMQQSAGDDEQIFAMQSRR
jgi:hypothetical protein